MKVFEFAKELGMETLALMGKIREWKLPIKSHMIDLDEEQIVQIRARLEAEKAAAKPAKKTTVRKKPAATAGAAATPETTTVEEPVKKAPAARKAAVKKVAIEKPVTATTKKVSAKASAKPSGIVLRRKPTAAEIAEQEAAAAAEAAAIAAQQAAEEEAIAAQEAAAAAEYAPEPTPVEVPVTEAEAPVQAGSTETVDNKPKKSARYEVVVPAQDSSRTPVRKNIVGRMDLSRVKEKEAQIRADRGPSFAPRPGGSSYSPRPGGPGMAPRPGGGPRVGMSGAAPMMPPGVGKDMRVPRSGAQRNIRAGFAPSVSIEEAEREEAERKKRGALQVEEMQNFSATEFRKREMIFQPKKKKGLLARESLKTEITTPSAHKRVVRVLGTMAMGELAQNLNVKSAQLTKILMNNGVSATENTQLDFDTIALIVPEFGFEAQNVALSEEELIKSAEYGNVDKEPIPRAPVVTVMGHVDHGKTTLLDSIRSANVASKEAGGITQHIGAYKVDLANGKSVTFIDTPGHAAFTEMRARGANVTDIAVIVVAADDGVMPQTGEAINHAKAAGVPIVVAVNKIDKPGVQIEKIKQQLTEFELVPEEWGGTTIFCPVSALQKTGVEELLEQLALVAEMEELRANPDRSALGVVVESRMEKGRGNVATVLIQDGTLKVGDAIVLGKIQGRVRQMTNDRGQIIKEAGPSVPVDIIGLDGSPVAGDKFMAAKDDRSAAALASFRARQEEAKVALEKGPMSIEALLAQMQTKDVKELPVILKVDVTGSLEAIKGLIAKAGNDEVRVKVIHSAVGGITESDILLASTSKGIVIGFNVRPDNSAQKTAKSKGVDVKYYNIIYELADDLKKALSGLLKPEIVEKTLGRAEVRNTFTVPKIGTIAGCAVVDGKITRPCQLRLLRDGRVVYEGKLASLKRFKDDVKEVATGFECGIGIENFNDIKAGDIIEAFVRESIQRSLE